MPLYVANDETINMIRYALGVFKYRDYLSGFSELSAYLASLSFERTILQTGVKFGLDREFGAFRYEITDVINFLRKKQLIDESEYKKLVFCRDFRNNVMHKGATTTEIQETKKILKTLCEMIGLALDEELEKREFEDILSFGKRPTVKREFSIIQDSDFDNFIILYEKALALHFNLEKPLSLLGLKPEEVSEFVPNSGGIWLPWVLGESGGRSHIRRATLGITFTPNSIRVGIDFGSKAYKAKQQYYSLLLENKIDEVLSKLTESNYLFYDTYWYYHIRNLRAIQKYFDSSQEIKHELHITLEEVNETLNRLKPMAGHKFLIGKIFQRNTAEFTKVIESLPNTISNIFNDLRPLLKKIENFKMSTYQLRYSP
ncbi:MAG: hypothetical protein QXQ94_08800 [Candidatus Bathyarchaeia archaeon]